METALVTRSLPGEKEARTCGELARGIPTRGQTGVNRKVVFQPLNSPGSRPCPRPRPRPRGPVFHSLTTGTPAQPSLLGSHAHSRVFSPSLEPWDTPLQCAPPRALVHASQPSLRLATLKLSPPLDILSLSHTHNSGSPFLSPSSAHFASALSDLYLKPQRPPFGRRYSAASIPPSFSRCLAPLSPSMTLHEARPNFPKMISHPDFPSTSLPTLHPLRLPSIQH